MEPFQQHAGTLLALPEQFQNPERFFRVGGEIKAVPYKPEKDHER